MIRRIIMIVLVSALVAAVVLGFLWLRMKFSARLELKEAIPGDFILCLETKDYNRFSSAIQNHSNIWSEFQEYEIISTLNTHIRSIDSLKRAHPGLNNLFRGSVFVSVYSSGDSLVTLFALSSPERNATDQLLKLISNETEIVKENFENFTIYNLNFGDNIPQRLSFYESRGILLLSPSEELLKRSILHLNAGKNIFQGDNYENLLTTLGEDVEAHLFVNFQYLKKLASKILEPEIIPDLAEFTSHAALDLEIKPDQVILNGFSEFNDSLDQQLSLFMGQEAMPMELFTAIPSTMAYLKWLGLSSPEVFRTQLQEKFPATGNIAEFRDGFFNHFNGQAAELILKESNISYPGYMLISVKSGGQAETFFQSNLEKINGGKKLESQKIRINENVSIETYRLPIAGIEEILFGDLMGNAGYEWYCFYENNMILGNSIDELEQYIYLNTLGKTLENDDEFRELKDNFSSRSNYFIFVDPGRYFPEILKLMQTSASDKALKHEESWKKLNAVAFQSTVTVDMNYFRMFANYTGQLREQVNTVWERKLDANLVMKPAVVSNHNNGEKEIFVQDELNNIYLISNAGAILWKQKTDDKILSEIFQIDYYRNGKLQYLFNTENKIWLLDRNGNSVEKFPVNLRQKASAGISLFDYDNDGDYRIPVPTRDKDILMYDKNGNIVSGWRFRKADHMIRFPMKHYRLGNRDFLVSKDNFRLYITDRRGRIRVEPSRQIDFSLNNPVYYMASGGSEPRLIASDKTGDVYAFYFNGKTEKLLESRMSEKHYFIPADINGDSREEFIFIDSARLEAYDRSSRLLFSEIYPESIDYPPVVYTFSSTDKKIGIVATGSERIYLVNNDGSIYKGFPLKGSSLFSISSFPGLKDRFNLIVGNKDNFLYNYSVK